MKIVILSKYYTDKNAGNYFLEVLHKVSIQSELYKHSSYSLVSKTVTLFKSTKQHSNGRNYA